MAMAPKTPAVTIPKHEILNLFNIALPSNMPDLSFAAAEQHRCLEVGRYAPGKGSIKPAPRIDKLNRVKCSYFSTGYVFFKPEY
jgi:hypothetical protein